MAIIFLVDVWPQIVYRKPLNRQSSPDAPDLWRHQVTLSINTPCLGRLNLLKTAPV